MPLITDVYVALEVKVEEAYANDSVEERESDLNKLRESKLGREHSSLLKAVIASVHDAVVNKIKEPDIVKGGWLHNE